MELLQLKYFCHAAESENFSATAKAFSVPASNISQTIKRLEKEVGVPLFNRNANRVTLNLVGKEFYKKIKIALKLITNARADASKETASVMKIGIFSNRRLVINAVEKFRKSYGNIDFIISHDRKKPYDDFDLIISDRLENVSSMRAQKFFSERMLLATNKNIFKNGITLENIKQTPFVSMPEGTGLYALNQSICASLGFSPRIALQSDDPFYIRKCIEFGLGICFVPEFSWQGQFSESVTLTHFGNYTRDIYLYRRSSELEPWYVEEFYSQLIEEYNLER